MQTAEEIKQLAYERLQEAVVLCDNGKYDGAFYLAGYSVELMLKAKICEQFGIDDLFDDKCKVQNIADVRKAVKTHDIAVLFILSGLFKKFATAKAQDKVLARTNAQLFDSSGRCLWNEQMRYRSIGSQKSKNVQELVELLQDKQGLLQWIEAN